MIPLDTSAHKKKHVKKALAQKNKQTKNKVTRYIYLHLQKHTSIHEDIPRYIHTSVRGSTATVFGKWKTKRETKQASEQGPRVSTPKDTNARYKQGDNILWCFHPQREATEK